MYLDFEAYQEMGGNLEHSAFAVLNRKAEYLLRAQTGGQTGQRLDELINSGRSLPQCIKDCIFFLIDFLSAPGVSGIASESENLGGQSETVSYKAKTSDEVQAECEEIIKNCLYGGGLSELLYKGVD